MFPFFFSSGLFLGWSLGANDASNVFGTAVGSRMVRFSTAAIYCSIFVIIGAVVSGIGASKTLGTLGAVNTLPGAFMVALSAAITVYGMIKIGYPASTSQAIVGSIMGWNFFSDSLNDYGALAKITSTWIVCPLLSATFAILLYFAIKLGLRFFRPHMFTLDKMTRYGLLLVGIFGSYALGANNIANVMGVFVPVANFPEISVPGLFTLSAAQQLFLIGGISIAVGVITYSKKMMLVVGNGIIRLSPIAAFTVVAAHSLVLFIFSSTTLSQLSTGLGFPPIPLVPVSSSQAIVGAVVGLGLLKGGHGIRWRTVGGIVSGWVTTPLIACAICFISLFFLQNVFRQETHCAEQFRLDEPVFTMLQQHNISTDFLELLEGKIITTQVALRNQIEAYRKVKREELDTIMRYAKLVPITITAAKTKSLTTHWLSIEQKHALSTLHGQNIDHDWQLHQALANASPAWRPKKGDTEYNRSLANKLDFVTRAMKDK